MPVDFALAEHWNFSARAQDFGLSLGYARDGSALDRWLHSCVAVAAVAAVVVAAGSNVISGYVLAMTANHCPNNDDYFGRGNFVHALLFSDLK